MARSPLTLAASVTSALPRVVVTGVGILSEGVSGRYDSAIADLEDGRRVVVRVPVDDDADRDLRAEARALTALTPGVRAVLPFGAPDVLGQTAVDGRHTLVQTLLPGYRVDAGHVPAGRGIATALGEAIAQVHDLPVTVVRDAGLPMLTATQVRDDAERLLDRAEATGELPFGLLRRWSSALGSDALWRFETTIVLGGVDPASFVFEDDADGVPVVTGLLTWGGVGVGDPAVDLRWTSSAPEAQSDVIEAYVRASHRAPDSQLAERARLHAELEFAKWLLHAHESGSRDLVADAVALLTSLDESVRDQPAVIHGSVSADEAIAASARVPSTLSGPVDTSMHTDTFDPETLASFLEDEARGADQRGADQREDAGATVPIELSGWTGLAVEDTGPTLNRSVEGDAPGLPTRTDPSLGEGDGTDVDDDPDEAARNALRRWTGTV